jgi:hypothetical protein
MARSFTLLALRTKVRERADIESSSFISDTELNGYISASYAVLYERLVLSGLAYFESTENLTAVAGTASYAISATHMSTIGVDWQRASGKYEPLRRLMPKERDNFPESSHPAVGYMLVGQNIVLYPTPSAAATYRHVYVPAPADLTTDGQTVDGVSGWEEFIVNDAARKCLMKEESDTSAIERELDREIDRLEQARLHRYMADTPRITDDDEGEVTFEYGYPNDHWRRLT